MTPRWVPALLLAVSLAAPGHAAGKCDSVTTSGRFTTIRLPSQLVATPFEVVPAVTRSQRDTLVASTGRTIVRSTDGGCTWQQVYSLDTDTPDSWWAKRSLTMNVIDVAVSQNTSGARTIYAVGRDSSSSLTVSLPFFTLVSTDAGAHWKFSEPPFGVDGLDHRCANVLVTAGPDPRLAHLTCTTGGLGELPLLIAAQCPTMQFVTTDAGATWRPVNARYSQLQPDLSRGPCGQMWAPTADAATPHLLWQMTTCSNQVVRSADGGKTTSVYATIPTGGCNNSLASAADTRGRGTLVVCGGGTGVWLAQGGKLVKTGAIPLRSHEIGTVRGCVVEPGSGRIVAYYLDSQQKQRVYVYDLGRKTWRLLGTVPADKNSRAMWDEFGIVEGWASPLLHHAYARRPYGDRVLRITL